MRKNREREVSVHPRQREERRSRCIGVNKDGIKSKAVWLWEEMMGGGK